MTTVHDSSSSDADREQAVLIQLYMALRFGDRPTVTCLPHLHNRVEDTPCIGPGNDMPGLALELPGAMFPSFS